MTLGNLQMDDLGNFEDAKRSYEAGLEIEPQHAFLMANMAFCLALFDTDTAAATKHALAALDNPAISVAGKLLLTALPCFWSHPNAWMESWGMIKAAVQSGDTELYSNYLDDLQRLLSWLVRQGQGAMLLQEMHAAKFHDEQAPLYHAVKTAVDGEDHLLTINPETRAPAQRIYTGLERMIRLHAPKPSPGKDAMAG